MKQYRLRKGLTRPQLAQWQKRYVEHQTEKGRKFEERCVSHGARARRRGHLLGEEFRDMAAWKSRRIVGHSWGNSDVFVREVSRVSIATDSERLRAEILLLLRGVGWPMASVILHFLWPERYPIIDYRALWSLGFDRPPRYDFDIYSSYAKLCRELASETGLGMREMDQALWMYSKANG